MIKSTVLFALFNLFFIGISVAQEFNSLDENGERHGPWRKYYDGAKQLRYEGVFNHGKEQGVFKFYNRKSGDQPSATKSYTSGSTILDVVFYQKDGKKASAGQMNGRKRIGEWTYYHKDGQHVMTTERYENDILNGERIVYYMNGQIAQKQYYTQGKLEGEEVNYSDKGVLLSSYTYVNGILEGIVKIYNDTGSLLREGYYKADKKDGIWKYYKNGKLEKEVKFPNNKIGVQN